MATLKKTEQSLLGNAKKAPSQDEEGISIPKMTIAKAAEFLNVSVQAVHKKLQNKNITCPKVRNKAYLTHKLSKELFNIQFTPKKVVFQIVKGGTGKTTALDNIASCLNSYGARVLMIDLDPQGNLTDAKGIDADSYPILIDVVCGEATIEDCIVNISEGLDLIPSRIENVVLENKIIYERINIQTFFDDVFQKIQKTTILF